MNCPKCRAELADPAAATCFHCGAALVRATNLQRGSVIAERYELLEPLGKGGMGVVYKAHDRVLDENVAIKLLRHEVASDPTMMKRFRQEIKLARKVRHRNVCGIHEYGEVGDIHYIAMEYIEGVNLRQLMQRTGGFVTQEGYEVAAQVGEGLQAIHDAGVIHRDLKTPNLMRDSKGFVRLMDFGIAKAAGAGATLGATGMGMILGTPEYMSPEQARGDKVDFRSDIYAYGIVVYELFTGSVPFRGDTPMATIFKQIQEPPPLDGPLTAPMPAALLPILKKALAKNAQDRYGSAGEMAAALRAAAGTTSEYATRELPPRTRGANAVEPQPDLATVAQSAPTPVPTAPTLAPTVVKPFATPAPMLATPASRRTPAGSSTAATAARLVTGPPAPSPAGRRGSRLAVGGALAVVAVVASALVWRVASRPSASSTTQTATASSPSPGPRSPEPPALELGVVVIDALPWGEVTGVVDQDGHSHPIVGTPYTPLVLSLPPGSYTVSVRNPGARQPTAIPVTVSAGRLEERLVEFHPVDAAEYFKRTGS